MSGKLDGEDAQVLIDQSLRGISLSASTAGTTSTLTIKAGDVTLSSAQINFIGMVTISDLSTSGKTIINGDNVTTGALGSVGGNTRYDLDAGTLRTGRDGSTRVEINDSGIRWYYQNYLTGVLYSQYGKTYIGDNSRDTFLGWFSSGTPNFEFTNGGKTNTFGRALRFARTGSSIAMPINSRFRAVSSALPWLSTAGKSDLRRLLWTQEQR